MSRNESEVNKKGPGEEEIKRGRKDYYCDCCCVLNVHYYTNQILSLHIPYNIMTNNSALFEHIGQIRQCFNEILDPIGW